MGLGMKTHCPPSLIQIIEEEIDEIKSKELTPREQAEAILKKIQSYLFAVEWS
jgi:hypothetical protein